MILPGSAPFGLLKPAAAGGGGGGTLSFIASAEQVPGANAITLPATINAGDLLVYFDLAAAIGAPGVTDVVPSGFTQAADNHTAFGSTFVRNKISYKIAAGNEDGASVSGFTGGIKAVLQFRGSTAVSAVSVGSVQQQCTNSNPSAANVLASAGAAPLIVLAKYLSFSGNAVSPIVFSPAQDAEIGGQTYLKYRYKIFNSTPQDVSIDMDDEGDANTLQGLYLACTLT